MVRSTRKKGLSSRNSNDVSIDNIIASRRSKRGKENGVDGNGPKRSEREPKPSPKLKALIESAHESKEKAKNRKRRSALLPLNRRSLEVSFDENKNTVKEYTIDESMSTNCSDDGSSGSVTDKDDNASGSDTEMTTAKKKKQKRDDIRSIVGIGNNSSHNKIDNIDNDSTTVKSTSPTGATTPPTGAPSLGKNCLSPSSPNLNRQDRKAKKGDDDDDNTDRGNNKKKKGDDENDKIDRGNDRVKKKEDGKAKKGDDDDDNNDRENNLVKKKKDGKTKKGDDDDDNTDRRKKKKGNDNDRGNDQLKKKEDGKAKKGDDDDDNTGRKINQGKKKEHRVLDGIKTESDTIRGSDDRMSTNIKREPESGLLISTKASRATSRLNYLKLPEMFDEIDANVDDEGETKLALIEKIYKTLKHPAIKCLWDEAPTTDPIDIVFPLKHLWFHNGHYRNLTRNPATTSDKFLCYGGYPHIDLATQLTFLKRDDNKSWCPLPANFYELMLRHKYTIGGELDKNLSMNRTIGKNLFDNKVVDILIFGNNHFSRVSVINASLVLDEGNKFADDNDPRPCMIHINSMNEGPGHITEKIGTSIRRFINDFFEAHGISLIRKCRKKNFPIVGINVTTQTDDDSCAFHTIVQRYQMMKALKDLGNITMLDIDGCVRGQKIDGSNSDSDSDSDSMDDDSDTDGLTLFDRLKYDPADVKLVKEDLRKIVACLKKIKKTDVDDLDDIDFDSDSDSDDIDNDNSDDEEVKLVEPIKRPKAFRMKKQSVLDVKKRNRSVRNDEKKQEEESRLLIAQQRVGKFDGKLGGKPHKKLKEKEKEMTREPKRKKGERAASLQSYHDIAHRRGLHSYATGTLEYQKMNRFESVECNETMNPAHVISFIYNPIGEHPDRVGKHYAPYHRSPQLLVLNGGHLSDQELQERADHFASNLKSYKKIYNKYNLDLEIMGERSKDLDDFVQNKSERDYTSQDKSENKEAHDKIPEIKSSPKKNDVRNYNDENDDEEVDLKLLGQGDQITQV